MQTIGFWDFRKKVTRAQRADFLKPVMDGGQALVIHCRTPHDTSACFKKSPTWGKLYDQDEQRLVQTAKSLGVSVAFVHHAGRPHQHVDLCGAPLSSAIKKFSEE